MTHTKILVLVVVMSLLFLNLKILIKKMPIYFIMLISVLFSTIIGTIFVYNYYLASEMDRNYYHEGNRSYYLGGEFMDLESQLNELIESHSADIQRIYFVLKNNDDYILCNFFGESSLTYKVQLGNYFSDESKNQILIPSSSENGIDQLGGTYFLDNKEFIIIGISSIDAYEIQYHAIIPGEIIESIVIVAQAMLTEQSTHLLENSISGLFPDSQISRPAYANADGMSNDYFVIFFILLLGLLNLSFILTSLMEKRKQQQAIFYILGCKRVHIVLLYLMEILMIGITIFFLSVLITKFILFNALNYYDAFFYHVISANQYVRLFLVYTLFITLLLLFQLIRFFRKTPFELKRR